MSAPEGGSLGLSCGAWIFGIAIGSSEVSYVKIYKTSAQRDALAATYGSNKALSALFGPAPQLQTVGGFNRLQDLHDVMALGAVWGFLTSTRLLRGEEDSDRWDLLLVGLTTRRRAAAQAIAGFGVGVVDALGNQRDRLVLFPGRSSNVGIAAGPSVYFALAMVATAAMFWAVGAVTSQSAATRRQAASYGGAFPG